MDVDLCEKNLCGNFFYWFLICFDTLFFVVYYG